MPVTMRNWSSLKRSPTLSGTTSTFPRQPRRSKSWPTFSTKRLGAEVRCFRGREMFLSGSSLEPAAAVSQPPRDVSDRNGRPQSPPERQNEIGGEPEHGEREPEDLALHNLDCKSFPPFTIWVGGLKKNFGFRITTSAVETGLGPSPMDAVREPESRVSTGDQAFGFNSSMTL